MTFIDAVIKSAHSTQKWTPSRMNTTIKGPAIFLAQFMGDRPPFDNLKNNALSMDVSALGYIRSTTPKLGTAGASI